MLEENPAFNAGRGSVLTADGHAELDAAIMDGASARCGAVAGLRTTRAPVSAARAAMEHSPHVLLTYEGADHFAREQGLEQVANDWFVIPERAAPARQGDGRRRAGSTATSNMARSARSRSIRRAMSPRRPRPAG